VVFQHPRQPPHGEKRKKVLKTSSTLAVLFDFSTCHNLLVSYGYGGDDGARTRDLCRDMAEVCWEIQVVVKPAIKSINLSPKTVAGSHPKCPSA
jgi:hypothetical protein